MNTRRKGLTGIPHRLAGWRYSADAVLVLLLTGFSLFLARFLFHWHSDVLASDLSGTWAWFFWFKESLVTFHQVPSWSPLWLGGMPFTGIVPPGGYITALPCYLITGDIPAAYNLSMALLFSLAGASMYVYLKHVSGNRLISFGGALIYVILPVHSCSMMFWGHHEIISAYAMVPMVLYLTDRFLDRNGRITLILLGLVVSLVLLLQIEYALIFLLFYICYLIFSLAARRIGPRTIMAMARRNKIGFALCLLVLLIPFGFYVTVLLNYSDFSSLTEEQVSGGLPVYTFQHFGQHFQERLPGSLQSFLATPRTECYSGGASFVILLGATVAVLLDRGRRRNELLFFLIAGMASLILSMGVYGPLFPALKGVIPFFSGMRVPLRFYHIFALCLPVLFALTFLSLRGMVSRLPNLAVRRQKVLVAGVPLILLAALVVDLSPYFDFYRHRVLNRDQFTAIASFLHERVRKDSPPAGEPVRVLVLPDGADPDRLATFETHDGDQFTIEVSQTWLTWDQYQGASEFDSTVDRLILRGADHMAFYSDLLSYDYVLRYRHRLLPAGADPTYLRLMDELDQIVDAVYDDEMRILLYCGSLGTDYYEVRLYKVNRDVLSNARFHESGRTLFVDSGDLYFSNTLWEIYDAIGGRADPAVFLNSVAAVSAPGGLPEAVRQNMADIAGLCYHGRKAILLSDDPLAGRILSAEGADANGWTDCETPDTLGFPGSGLNIGVSDAAAIKGNYLSLPFSVASEGDWLLTLDYFSGQDAGMLDVLIDGRLVATINGYGSRDSMEQWSATLALTSGQHQLRFEGRWNPLTAAAGIVRNRVEVGRISLLNEKKMPEILARSRMLWDRVHQALESNPAPGLVSGFRCSPTGVSLDINAAGEGILSVAYYYNPWWKVFVDGEETGVIRVNGVFPGCLIQGGQHHVEFVCDYPTISSLLGLGR